MNFLDYFRLRENPFGETPDPKFYYPSRGQEEALRKVAWALEENKSFLVVTGEAGNGKTLFSRMLYSAFREDANCAVIVNPLLSKQELIAAICRDFGVSPGATLQDLSDWLLAEASQGRKCILVVDEAQSLSHECLELVRLLTNLENSSRKLLQIVLLGQPELDSRLDSHELRQLKQRVFLHVRMNGLGPDETSAYIRHRIEKAGGGNFVRFDGSAARAVHSLSGGCPRLVNKLCESALRFAALGSTRRITGAQIRRMPLAEIGIRAEAPGPILSFLRRLQNP